MCGYRAPSRGTCRRCHGAQATQHGSDRRINALRDTHGPQPRENQIDHQVAKQDANDAVASDGQVEGGGGTLDDAEKERERDLKPRIGNARTAGGDPGRQKRNQKDDPEQAPDRSEIRDHIDNRGDAGRGADEAPCDAQDELLNGLCARAERDDVAGDEAGMDARPVEQRVQRITEHRSAGGLERVVHVLRDW